MKDAEIILKLIENVSPDDTAKLDEIDNRVWEYLNSTKLGHKNYRSTPYTRSRDALKAIRPEGWFFDIEAEFWADGVRYNVKADTVNGDIFEPSVSENFKTEELAELHAIIQAIAYERAGEGGV